MRVLLLLAMPLILLPAGALRAQALPPALHVEGVGEPVSVEPATHRGYPAYPAWTLRSLGAVVEPTARGARVAFGSDTLEFHTGSPFFHAAGKPWQLVEPAYHEGGVFYLPHQLFAEWLPRRFPDRLAYAHGRLRLTSDRVASTPAAATAREAAGDAAEDAGNQARPEQSAPEQGAPGAVQPPRIPERQAPATPAGKPARVAPLVIIDAGHGGPDPGAIGPSGVQEKAIVLQVSKRLAKVLAARGYDIRMTRTTDTLIALEDRPHLANEWRGNRPGLFLSIHANNVGDRRVRGFETFFLSDARTEDEQRVAEMENAAVAYETQERVLASDDLGFIRNNLRNDFYIRASYDLAGLVQKEFSQFHDGRNRGVKQAGFIVLIGAFMPAVLVELAFISNPAEERLLGSGSFQMELAEGIANAVDEFFEDQGERWLGATP